MYTFTVLLKRALAAGIAATCMLAGSAASAQYAQNTPQGTPQSLRTVPIKAGMYVIEAQVASSPLQREIGLMYRKEMAPHQGMIFVFEEPEMQCFWMRNTLIPLAAAFVAEDGTIVNIEEMAPLSDASHCSTKPVRYVLEMNKGWFAQKNLKAGFKLVGLPK